MTDFLENPFFLLAITFIFFFIGRVIQQKTRSILLNPILLTTTALILFIHFSGISFEAYQKSGSLIEFWLKPAIVALGVPLYLQLEQIKKQWLPLLLSQLTGCLAGIISVVLLAKWLGATPEVIISMSPKSVTTPIAMEVSSAIGGIPALTAAVVVIVGMFGGIFGFKIMQLLKIGSPIAQGLSIGTAAHAVGTSSAMNVSPKYGAFAGVGLIINGILTALLTPVILQWLGIL